MICNFLLVVVDIGFDIIGCDDGIDFFGNLIIGLVCEMELLFGKVVISGLFVVVNEKRYIVRDLVCFFIELLVSFVSLNFIV